MRLILKKKSINLSHQLINKSMKQNRSMTLQSSNRQAKTKIPISYCSGRTPVRQAVATLKHLAIYHFAVIMAIYRTSNLPKKRQMMKLTTPLCRSKVSLQPMASLPRRQEFPMTMDPEVDGLRLDSFNTICL